MKIIEKCATLSTLTKRYEEMVANQEKAKSLEARRLELNIIYNELSVCVDKAKVYLIAEVLKIKELPPLDSIKEKVSPLLETFKEDSLNITKGHLYASIKKRANSLKSVFDKTFKAAWKKFYIAQKVTVDNALLKSYLESVQFRREAESIIQLNKELDRYQGHPPENKEELDRFLLLTDKLRQEYNELATIDLPDEIAAFLRATNSYNGASLDLLTPSVREWLRDKEIYNSFRIKK